MRISTAFLRNSLALPLAGLPLLGLLAGCGLVNPLSPEQPPYPPGVISSRELPDVDGVTEEEEYISPITGQAGSGQADSSQSVSTRPDQTASGQTGKLASDQTASDRQVPSSQTGQTASGQTASNRIAGAAGKNTANTRTAAETPVPETSPAPDSNSGNASTFSKTTNALVINSVWNFRDVAGSGLKTSAGKQMRTGVIYRSGKLQHLSKADNKSIQAAGVKTIIDLRTPAVAKRSPDPKISKAKNKLVNIWVKTSASSSNPKTVAAAQEMKREQNRDFVRIAAQRKKIAEALRIIINATGSVVIHCSEGKDRTGWISYLLQAAAGVTEQDSLREYEKSNTYRAKIVAETLKDIRKKKGNAAAQIESAILLVEKSYLQAGISEMRSAYGDITGYLKNGLGLKSSEITKLKKKLLA